MPRAPTSGCRASASATPWSRDCGASRRWALCGPLGSLGDRIFWAGWLPMCAAIGVVLVAFGARAWAALAFLAIYNAAHLATRAWGLRVGWRQGMMVAAALSAPVLRAAGRAAGPLAALGIGFQ